MDNYRYSLFNPEEKLSEKREFESYNHQNQMKLMIILRKKSFLE